MRDDCILYFATYVFAEENFVGGERTYHAACVFSLFSKCCCLCARRMFFVRVRGGGGGWDKGTMRLAFLVRPARLSVVTLCVLFWETIVSRARTKLQQHIVFISVCAFRAVFKSEWGE